MKGSFIIIHFLKAYKTLHRGEEGNDPCTLLSEVQQMSRLYKNQHFWNYTDLGFWKGMDEYFLYAFENVDNYESPEMVGEKW